MYYIINNCCEIIMYNIQFEVDQESITNKNKVKQYTYAHTFCNRMESKKMACD